MQDYADQTKLTLWGQCGNDVILISTHCMVHTYTVKHTIIFLTDWQITLEVNYTWAMLLLERGLNHWR